MKDLEKQHFTEVGKMIEENQKLKEELKFKCCFCGKECRGWGNDPRPIAIAGEDLPRCCDECDAKIVIPTRQRVW